MSSYRPTDSKREEFRKYLERAGVMDALTKVLVSLYEEPEKPADALEYVRQNLSDNRPELAELEAVKAELEECKMKIESLEAENTDLRTRLAVYEPPEDQPAENGEQPAEG